MKTTITLSSDSGNPRRVIVKVTRTGKNTETGMNLRSLDVCFFRDGKVHVNVSIDVFATPGPDNTRELSGKTTLELPEGEYHAQIGSVFSDTLHIQDLQH